MADINRTAAWVTARLEEVGAATNEGLYTLVNSNNIGTFVAKNVSGVVAVANGGTGANNPTTALQNLGGITANDVSLVGKTGLYSDILNPPTIPTITNTYNSASSNGMSGIAVASAVQAETTRATNAENTISGNVTTLQNLYNNLGFSVVSGKLNVTYTE